MSRQANVIEIYGNNAAVLCPGCPTIFIVSAVVNKKNGRTCPGYKKWIAKLKQENGTVTFSEVADPASHGKG
jgi:hypothetical protein